MIDRMRAFFKGQSLETRPIEVSEAHGEVAALARADAAARHVKLEPGVLGRITAGERRPRTSTAGAAQPHPQRNGRAQRNHTNDRRVTVGARLNSPRSIEIAVSDTGSGVSRRFRAPLRAVLYNRTPKVWTSGCQSRARIMEAHGGRLWAENNDGGGATFRRVACYETGAT